jgi:cellobiose PTS system EIIB component
MTSIQAFLYTTLFGIHSILGGVMMNILLCCAAGMSTSLLVTKMEEYATKQGIEGKIWAVSADEVGSHIEEADVLLLGPQVRYMLHQLTPVAQENNIPIDVIPTVDYGMMNGANVVKYALKLTEE